MATPAQDDCQPEDFDTREPAASICASDSSGHDDFQEPDSAEPASPSDPLSPSDPAPPSDQHDSWSPPKEFPFPQEWFEDGSPSPPAPAARVTPHPAVRPDPEVHATTAPAPDSGLYTPGSDTSQPASQADTQAQHPPHTEHKNSTSQPPAAPTPSRPAAPPAFSVTDPANHPTSSALDAVFLKFAIHPDAQRELHALMFKDLSKAHAMVSKAHAACAEQQAVAQRLAEHCLGLEAQLASAEGEVIKERTLGQMSYAAAEIYRQQAEELRGQLEQQRQESSSQLQRVQWELDHVSVVAVELGRREEERLAREQQDASGGVVLVTTLSCEASKVVTTQASEVVATRASDTSQAAPE